MKVRKWADEVEFLWIRNLLLGDFPEPVAEVPAGISAMYATSGGRLVILLDTNPESSRLAVANPQRLEDESLYMSASDCGGLI